MNLHQVNELLEHLKRNNSNNENSELIIFYENKKETLLKEIKERIKTGLKNI